MSCLRMRSSSRSSGPSYTLPTVTEKGNALSSFCSLPFSVFVALRSAKEGPTEESPGCPALCAAEDGRSAEFSSGEELSGKELGFNSSITAPSRPQGSPPAPSPCALPASSAQRAPWPSLIRHSESPVPAEGSAHTYCAAPESEQAPAQSSPPPSPCTQYSQCLPSCNPHKPSQSSPGQRTPCADRPPGTHPDFPDPCAARAPGPSPWASASASPPAQGQ